MTQKLLQATFPSLCPWRSQHPAGLRPLTRVSGSHKAAVNSVVGLASLIWHLSLHPYLWGWLGLLPRQVSCVSVFLPAVCIMGSVSLLHVVIANSVRASFSSHTATADRAYFFMIIAIYSFPISLFVPLPSSTAAFPLERKLQHHYDV